MTTTRIKGGASTGKMTNMLAGLTRKNPPGVDKSMGIGSSRVDQDAVRKGVGEQPPTIGPRNA